MHVFEREIILEATPEEIWAFLATPDNLNQLTPPNLNFRVLSAVPGRMYNGLIILYEIQIPPFGRRRWRIPYEFWRRSHALTLRQESRAAAPARTLR